MPSHPLPSATSRFMFLWNQNLREKHSHRSRGVVRRHSFAAILAASRSSMHFLLIGITFACLTSDVRAAPNRSFSV